MEIKHFGWEWKVFVGHGKSKTLVYCLKSLLLTRSLSSSQTILDSLLISYTYQGRAEPKPKAMINFSPSSHIQGLSCLNFIHLTSYIFLTLCYSSVDMNPRHLSSVDMNRHYLYWRLHWLCLFRCVEACTTRLPAGQVDACTMCSPCACATHLSVMLCIQSICATRSPATLCVDLTSSKEDKKEKSCTGI